MWLHTSGMMRINEIFYSLQGEGRYAGTPAVFVRFSGCNLRCGFCDTAHESFAEMSESEIMERIAGFPAKRVVLTGGEPTLQLTRSFMETLHERGYRIHVETNGTHRLPAEADWVVCSPKGAPLRLEHVNELKVVFTGDDTEPERYSNVEADCYYLQPCDVKDVERNAQITAAAVEYVKAHPQWNLSLQTHKFINIP